MSKTTQNAGHTQDKWRVVSLEGFYFIEFDGKEQSGCYTHKADAERIVKAHNSYKGLLEALKSTRGIIKALGDYSLLNTVEGAIAQAEGE